jgi:hypothetical protein
MSKFKFDVFLSYNTKDGPVVKEIALRLRDEFGLGIWFDSWNMIPGEPLQEQIEVGLKNCEATVIFIGKAGFGKWQNEEMRMAVAKRVSDPSTRVFAVWLPTAPKRKSNLPEVLKRYPWVDFRKGIDDSDIWRKLIAGIKKVPPAEISIQTPNDRTSDDSDKDDVQKLWESIPPKQWLNYFGEVQAAVREPKDIEFPQILETETGKTLDAELQNFLRSDKRLLIIHGQSGIGKSVFLREKCREFSSDAISAFKDLHPETYREDNLLFPPIPIPIYYSLLSRRIESSQELASSLAEYISHPLGRKTAEQAVDQLFNSKLIRWIVFFDNFDRLPDSDEKREKFIEALVSFLDKFSNFQVVLATRLGYERIPVNDWRKIDITISCLNSEKIFNGVMNVTEMPQAADDIKQLLLTENDLMTICSIPRHLNGFLRLVKDIGSKPLENNDIPDENPYQPFENEHSKVRRGAFINAVYEEIRLDKGTRPVINENTDTDWYKKIGLLALKLDGRTSDFLIENALDVMSDQNDQRALNWTLDIGILQQVSASGRLKFYTKLTQLYFAANLLAEYREDEIPEIVIHYIKNATNDFNVELFDIYKDITARDPSQYLRRLE